MTNTTVARSHIAFLKPFSPLAGIKSTCRAIYFIVNQSHPALFALLALLSLLTLFSATPASAQPITNPANITRVSSFQYNAQGLLVSEVIEPDSAQSCLITNHAYDGFGNKSSVSTAACAGATGATLASASTSRTASTSYTADGRFPAVTANALGHSESKQYDARFGLPTSLVGPNGLTTTWAYDGFGRKTRETRSDGTWSSWSYSYCTDAGAACPAAPLLAQGAGSTAVSPALAQTAVWVATEQSCSASNGSTCQQIAPDKRQYHDALNRVIRVQTQGFDGGVSAGGGAVQPPSPSSKTPNTTISAKFAANPTPTTVPAPAQPCGSPTPTTP